MVFGRRMFDNDWPTSIKMALNYISARCMLLVQNSIESHVRTHSKVMFKIQDSMGVCEEKIIILFITDYYIWTYHVH